ncbi:short-chain dehydrogenases/reductase [Aspergillus similis]
MAYDIRDARKWNSSLREKHINPVAVFVGATSGIGEEAAKCLSYNTDQPTIYIVGRNEAAGARITEAMKAQNPRGSYFFFSADASRLENVDKVCREIQAREKRLDLLFLSTGSIAFFKQETPSGIDLNHILRYYSRMRFIHNLAALLLCSQSARVVSVLAGGKEGPIDGENLDLRKAFSLGNSNVYPASMTSLAFEHLASVYPSISFIHEFPGIVATPLLKHSIGSVMGTLIGLLLWPFSLSAAESGEWSVFVSTAPFFPPRTVNPDGGEKTQTVKASTGVVGDGCYVLDHTGQDVADQKLMTDLRAACSPERVWVHTLQVFDQLTK